MTWYVIADDLSGAAEAAASLARLDRPSVRYSTEHSARFAQTATVAPTSSVLVLAPVRPGNDTDAPAVFPASAIVVVDSDNRGRTPEVASVRLQELLLAMPSTASLFLKFDSLVRGNVGSELTTARRARPVLFCPAVPSNGRTVINGTVNVDGIALHHTELWAAERERPASSIISQLLRTNQTHTVNQAHGATEPGDTAPRADFIALSLSDVRSDVLVDVLRDAALWGQIVVCDAQTEHDLDRIAIAGIALGYALAGSSGLSGAVARAESAAGIPNVSVDAVRDDADASTSPHPTDHAPAARDTLFILGTASSALGAQLTALEMIGVAVMRVGAHHLATTEIPHGTVAVVVNGPVDSSRSAVIVRDLAALACRAHADRHLVLSGGETARAVLDALDITTLHPVAQAHPGAVVSLGPDGRLIATRPGSYGAPTSLIDILSLLDDLQPNHKKGTTP